MSANEPRARLYRTWLGGLRKNLWRLYAPSKKVFFKKQKNAIPNNRDVMAELPQAVRDLADLLAEIACSRLNTTLQEPDNGKGTL